MTPAATTKISAEVTVARRIALAQRVGRNRELRHIPDRMDPKLTKRPIFTIWFDEMGSEGEEYSIRRLKRLSGDNMGNNR